MTDLKVPDTFKIVDGVAWVGDVAYRHADIIDHCLNDEIPELGIYHRDLGFSLRFENGYILSVRWGSFMHGTNHWAQRAPGSEPALPEDFTSFMGSDGVFREEATHAECAVIDGTCTVRIEGIDKDMAALITWPDGETVGDYVNTKQVNLLVKLIQHWPSNGYGQTALTESMEVLMLKPFMDEEHG